VIPAPSVAAAVSSLAREESGRVLAILARRYRDLDLADEAVQDALVQAVESWPHTGIPDQPAAWLFTVANRKAIDALRRAASERRRLLASAPELLLAPEDPPDAPLVVDGPEVGDEHLRLVLLCCHPALDIDAQVALTLRLVGGLSTPEIAQAFLVPESTLAQRIVRAKNKIRQAAIPLSIPVDLSSRVGALLTVLYLIFNEGYLSRGVDTGPIRVDLIDEAIRLTRLASGLLPHTAEIEGLLALELFGRARTAGRTDRAGDLVLLAQQDRSLWDRDGIQKANAMLAAAMSRMSPGRFQIEALIAARHANSADPEHTDWPAIVVLYGQLVRMTSSPVVALNHAAAIAMAEGPAAGLARLDGLAGLDNYYLLHSTRAELLLLLSQTDAARESFRLAHSLASNPAELRHLGRRIASLGPAQQPS
jgi:RNA polymerase sigma-70 factor (ECF subfamily)